MTPPTAAPQTPTEAPNLPAGAPNSSLPHSPSRLPKARRRSLLVKLALVLGVALLGLSAAAGGWFYFKGGTGGRPDLILHTVRRENLQLTIVERGTLEAANNADVTCKVKARSQGSITATTIKWVIDDGSHVKRNRPEHLRDGVLGGWVWPDDDQVSPALHNRPPTKEELADPATKAKFEAVKIWSDLLVELDASGLEEQEKQQSITLEQAGANLTKAEEDYKITESQNESDIKTAGVNLELAVLTRDAYLGRAVRLETAAGLVGLAAVAVADPWAARLPVFVARFEESGGEYFQTRKEIEGRLLLARSDLEMWRDRVAWSERMVRGNYIGPAQLQADRARNKSAEVALQKIEEELRVLSEFTYEHKKTDLESKVAEARRALDRAHKQATAKMATAIADKKAKQSIHLQETDRLKDIKEQIRNCKIYAPKDGLVVYHIPESARWGAGRAVNVAQGESVTEGQKIMRIPELRQMLVNTKVHEAMVSRLKSEQPARIRIDAFPDRDLRGRVKTIATVASQTDWMSSDVKVYQTMVSIDEQVENLKPGMSAEVTILTDSQVKDALTIPVQAVLGTVEMGRNRKCFVVNKRGVHEERDILVGISNDKMVEVKEGLEEGDQVVVNPRALLSEGSPLKPGLPGNGKSGGPDAPAPEAGQGQKPAAPGPGAGAPPDAKGGPGAGVPGDKPKGPGGDKPKAGGSGMSAEDRAKMTEVWKNATPQQRKEMLEKVPAEYRDKIRQGLKAQGIEIPD
jgi:RND family efflux transporter MFP subunit